MSSQPPDSEPRGRAGSWGRLRGLLEGSEETAPPEQAPEAAEGAAEESYGRDFGYCFPVETLAALAQAGGNGADSIPRTADVPARINHESMRTAAVRLKQRYELLEQIREHGGVTRYRGVDHE